MGSGHRLEGAARTGGPSRLGAAVLTAAVAVAVLSPALLGRGDDFPLSTFPMFSHAIDPVGSIDTVVGVTTEGVEVRLPPEIAAGTDEVIVAGSVVSDAVSSGPEALSRLCAAAASRLAADPASRFGNVVTVEIRTETYDAIAWFRGDRAPLSLETRVGCEVKR